MSVLARSFRHWTPRYLCDRTRHIIHTRRHRDDPWLTADAVRILQQWLRPTDVGLEWGSGRSTLWLTRRVARLTSIEHDRVWHARVRRMLDERQITHCDLRLLSMHASGEGTPEYVAAAGRIPGGSLDFVLVDGRLRDQCTEVALRVLKPGGVLVLDNAARYVPHDPCCPESEGMRNGAPTPLWASLYHQLDQCRRVWTCNGVFATGLYFKPAMPRGTWCR